MSSPSSPPSAADKCPFSKVLKLFFVFVVVVIFLLFTGTVV